MDERHHFVLITIVCRQHSKRIPQDRERSQFDDINGRDYHKGFHVFQATTIQKRNSSGETAAFENMDAERLLKRPRA
jgi:hypothetical protein